MQGHRARHGRGGRQREFSGYGLEPVADPPDAPRQWSAKRKPGASNSPAHNGTIFMRPGYVAVSATGSGRANETSMFFLIRCVFWLWVVFSTIFAQDSTHGTSARRPMPPPQASAAAQSLAPVAASWLRGAAAQVADRCAAAPATCLAVASQLSRLAAHREHAPAPTALPAAAFVAPVQVAQRADVPLPPRRPNFTALGDSLQPKLEKTIRRAYLMNQSRAEADF
jgi:hypothetical protein